MVQKLAGESQDPINENIDIQNSFGLQNAQQQEQIPNILEESMIDENQRKTNQEAQKRQNDQGASTRMVIQEVINLQNENQRYERLPTSISLQPAMEIVLQQLQSFQGKDKDTIKLLPLLKQLKEYIYVLTNEICQHIFDKYEPDQKLNKLNYILEAHFEDIQILINLPIQLIEQGYQNVQNDINSQIQLTDQNQINQSVINSNEESKNDQITEKNILKLSEISLQYDDNLKANFYSQVLGNITNLMLNEVSVQKQQYMCEILTLFHTVISKYLARDPTNTLLLDVSSNLFSWEKSLHQSVLPKYRSTEMKKNYDVYNFDQQNSTHIKRVNLEKEWREKTIKVGMKVDVVKEIKVNNINVSGWTRGIITHLGLQDEDQIQKNQDNIYQQQQIDSYREVVIKYEQDLDAAYIQLDLMDWRFAPLNSFTQDFDWRYALQINDNIDCMDNEKDWYKSTILKFRYQKNNDNEKVQEIFVGYRHFHPEGSKSDDDGNKYFGWSERYDSWISSGDIRVQRYHSIHSQYIKVEQQNKVYAKHLDFDDRWDTISSNNSPAYFSAPRNSYFQKFEIISDALNIFGHSKGFESIISNLIEGSLGKTQLTLQTINSYCLFLSSTMPLWHRQFVCDFIDRFNDALLRCLCYINTEANDQNKSQIILGPIQNDNFNSGLLEDMINKLVDPIWKRHNTIEMTGKILSNYQIGIGAALLSLSKLERRIQGLKYINEAIRTVRQPYGIHKLVTTKELIQSLRNLKIIDQIFGEGTHFELVHRSQDLIRLLFNEKEEILENEIDLIWNVCIKQGEQIKLEIYNNILDVIRPSYGTLSDQTKAQFIDKIDSIQPNLLIEKDIHLLNELGKKVGINFKKPENYAIKAANIMWSIAVLEKEYPIQLIKISRKNFQELISSWEDQYKEPYIALCIDNITSNKLPLQNLKIVTKLIESMNQSQYSACGRKTRQEFSQELIETQDFIGIIIQDLDKFVEYSNTCIKKGEINNDNYNTTCVSPNHYFTHLKNIKSRLNRIMNLLLFSKCKLQTQQIENIWDILVVKSEMREKDQNEFFVWFKRLLLKDQRRLMSEELMIELFRKKIVKVDFKMLKSLKITGLDCIVRLFVLVNELQGNVLDLDPNTQENSWNNQFAGYGTSYNNNNYRNNNQDQGNQNSNKTKINRFRVNIMPQDLEGINVLWSMMEAVDTANYNLFFMVQRTLINIYSNLSSLLIDKRDEINQCFIQECLKCLEGINQNNYIVRNDKEKRDSLSFICRTITSFFEGTEQFGVGNLKVQRQLDYYNYVNKVIFEIKLPIKRGIDASFIELNTYQNMTIWELKTLIAKNIDASPLSITFKRSDQKKPEIKDFHNLKLLSDLQFTDNESIQVFRSKNPDIVEVPLIDKRGKVVPELTNILKIWFIEFSQDKSKDEIIQEFLNMSKIQSEQNLQTYQQQLEIKLKDFANVIRVMTPQLCSYFIEQITQMQNIAVDDYRVLNLFTNHCKKIGNGNLLMEEFMEFYEDQAKQRPEIVKHNLNYRGIQNDLKEKLDLTNLNWNNDKRIIKNEINLPRTKLSQGDQIFSKFLELVELSQCDENDGMWNLLMNLQTNKQIYNQILNVEEIDELFGLNNQNIDLIEGQNASNLQFYKILYSLQIVLSLINEYKQKNECYLVLYLEQNELNNILFLNKQESNQNEQPLNQQDQNINEDNQPQQQYETNKMDADPVDQYDKNYPGFEDQQQNQITEKKYDKQIDDGNNDDYRNPINQSKDNDPQQAIPLPYHGPLLPGSASQHNQSNYDVPLAPSSQAALVGPPNQYNTQNQSNVQKQNSQNFKGIFIKQQINNSPALSDDEQNKRKMWLPLFLSKGGINKLIKLLRNLSHIHRQLETQNNQKLINQKIVKRCLREVMECIKILIVSQLCAQSNDKNISLNLQRKMSIQNQDEVNDYQNKIDKINNDVEMIDESQNENKELDIIQLSSDEQKDSSKTKIKKTKMQEEQQNTEEEMKPLIDLIKTNLELRFDFKQQMDLENFQSEILGLISEFIDKKDIKYEDIEIINQGLSIWLSCLVSDPKLLNAFYNEFYSSQVEDQLSNPQQNIVVSDQNIMHFSRTFVEKGIVSSEYRMREAFQNTVKFIVNSVESNQLKQPPLHFFIQLLISKFDYISQRHLSKQTRIYFSILLEILNKYFEEKQLQYHNNQFKNQINQQIGVQQLDQNPVELINITQFLYETTNRLLYYQSNEKRNSLMEDYTLIGFFDVIRVFIENSINSLTPLQFYELSIMLLEKCLFSFNFLPIESHIVQNVNLEQYERKLINKCLTKESNQACFNLLLKICRFSQDKSIIFNILQNFWLKQIYIVDKPPLPGFSPTANGRSFYNYSGIKNLGAVCYMNSMNQQFFNIPTLRYCLLAAQDNIAENIVIPDIVPYKGMEIDDNVLHQIMRMFGFLELTDRQSYDPTQFCFSLKNFGEPTNVREQKDAQEYLNIMFDQLEQQLKNTSQKYLIQNVFGGQFCYKKKCKNCGNVRQSIEDMLNISLEVKNQKSIYEGLRKFVQGEIIQDFNCEACNKRVDLEKQTSIKQLPNTLIIHLQRIIFDFDQLRNVKLNDRMEFPEILNMREFMSSEIEKKEKIQEEQKLKDQINQQLIQVNQIQEDYKNDDEQQIVQERDQKMNTDEKNINDENEDKKEQQNEIQNQNGDEDYEYRLVGVVDHMGSADAGHYLSYINVERDQDFNLHKKGQKISREEFFATEKYTWLEFNDRVIQSFKVKDLEQFCFGGQGNQNAYMLVYEKMLKRKMKIVLPQDIINLVENDSLACDGTAITRDSSQSKTDQIISKDNEIQHSTQQSYLNNSNGILDSTSQYDFHLLYAFPNLIQQIKEYFKNNNQQQRFQWPILENQENFDQLALQENFYFDKEKNEHIALLNFEDVRKFVPNNIYKAVHEDNKKFLSEKQIFSDAFFNSTLQLIEIALHQLEIHNNQGNLNIQQFELLFRIVDRVLFDLLANSNQMQSLKGMTDILIQMLQFSNEAVIYLVQHRIFIPQENLLKDERNFFETLSTHVNQEVREMASQILLTTLNRLIQIGGIQNENYVQSAVENILNQMDEECPKHWMRLDTYFSFIYDLVRSNSVFLRILLHNKIVFRLIVLMSKYNPNSMVYMNVCPPLEKLVMTICFIVRCFPCLVDIYDNENIPYEEGIDKQTLVLIQQNERGQSGLNIDIQNQYSKEQFDMDLVNQWLKLSDECTRSLFLKQKSLKQFLQNVTKNGYAIYEFSCLIAHLCYKNKDYSFKIAKHILKGTNTSGADELQPFLQIMKEYLTINDDLKDLRIEWIFGIPNFIMKSNTYQVYNQTPKIGVSFADQINTQVCKYFSPIYKSATTYYSRKDCALQALISNRRNQSKAVLYSLKTIFEAIIDDKSGNILRYLKNMDPPTYQFARYWDWIKPWIISEVDNNTRNQSIQAYRNELDLSISVLSLIEEIEKIEKQKLNQNSNKEPEDLDMNQNSIIEYPEDDGGPKSYLIWDITGASILDKKEDDRNKIEMWINQIACTVSKSFPTGENNLVLLDQFNSNQNNYQNGQGSSGGTGFMRSSSIGKLRGSQQSHQTRRRQGGRAKQGNSIQKRNKLVSENTRKNQKELNLKKGKSIRDDDADSEDASNDENGGWAVNTDNKQDIKQNLKNNQDSNVQVKNVRFADTNIEDENIDQDQINSDAAQNLENIEVQDPQEAPQQVKNVNVSLKVKEKIKSNQQEASVSVSESSDNENNVNNQKIYQSPNQSKQNTLVDNKKKEDGNDITQQDVEVNGYQNDGIRNQDQIETDSQWYQGVQPQQYDENNDENNQINQQNYDNQEEDENIEQYNSKCLLVFKVQNNSPFSQTIELTVSAKKDKKGNDIECNFRMPKSSILCEIMSGQSSNVLQVTKLDPKLEEWGLFDWDFKLIQKNQYSQNISGYPNKNNSGMNNDWQWNNGNYNNQGWTYDQQNANGMNDYGDGDNMIGSAVGGGSEGVKKCPACTFDNSLNNTQCEICQSPLN